MAFGTGERSPVARNQHHDPTQDQLLLTPPSSDVRSLSADDAHILLERRISELVLHFTKRYERLIYQNAACLVAAVFLLVIYIVLFRIVNTATHCCLSFSVVRIHKRLARCAMRRTNNNKAIQGSALEM